LRPNGCHWVRQSAGGTLYHGRARIGQVVDQLKRFNRIRPALREDRQKFTIHIALAAMFILIESFQTD